MLIVENIWKDIDNNPILKGISFRLKPGDVTVLFGESGSGKTTLLRILALLDQANRGSLYLLGNKSTDAIVLRIEDRESYYPIISVVFQQLFLWPHLTNRQNILLPLEENKVQSVGQQAYFQNVLAKKLGIDECLDQFPNQSSVGQKQRVALARALILNPKYLLLDEVTSAQDINHSRDILSLIRCIAQEQNLAILMITHNLKVTFEIADNFLFLNNGVIKEQGGIEIFQHPETSELKAFLKNHNMHNGF